MKARDAAIESLRLLPQDATLTQVVSALRGALQTTVEVDPPALYTGWRKAVSSSVTIISGVAACVTLALVAEGTWTKHPEDRLSFLGVYAFWTFAPPLWFFVEYVWLFDKLRGDPLRVEHFNTAQALAQKVWAALLVFLGVFALVLWDRKF